MFTVAALTALEEAPIEAGSRCALAEASIEAGSPCGRRSRQRKGNNFGISR
jgi:hypothetical protein